jgi:Ca2+/Na+ antiporter
MESLQLTNKGTSEEITCIQLCISKEITSIHSIDRHMYMHTRCAYMLYVCAYMLYACAYTLYVCMYVCVLERPPGSAFESVPIPSSKNRKS